MVVACRPLVSGSRPSGPIRPSVPGCGTAGRASALRLQAPESSASASACWALADLTEALGAPRKVIVGQTLADDAGSEIKEPRTIVGLAVIEAERLYYGSVWLIGRQR